MKTMRLGQKSQDYVYAIKLFHQIVENIRRVLFFLKKKKY